MNNKFLLTCWLALITFMACGQKTYIGAEGAVNLDVYDYIDNGTLLSHRFPGSGYVGINIRHDLNTLVFGETGLIRKSYYEGVGLTSSRGYSLGNAINTWLIPVRLGTRIKLCRKVCLVPVIGYTLGINSDYGYGDGGISSSEISKQDTILINMYSKLSLTKTFPLLQTGIGLEFLLLRTALLSVAANYYTGFKNLMTQDITYSDNSTSNTAKGISKGDILSFGIAIKYPVSNLWTQRGRK